MTVRTRQLPDMEAKCPECGLRAMVSSLEVKRTDPASMCRHAPWERCPKLTLEIRKARAAAQKL
jgi:hypothetical protein